jgi:ubiquinone/menaquinone biosynthesis C-methylase UbiE
VRARPSPALGIRTASLDGLVSCVVLPYTDEQRAVEEWGRVLRRGGVARVAVLQTDGRMRQYFRQNRLEVEQAPDAARFLGLPVFHYYLLRKR